MYRQISHSTSSLASAIPVGSKTGIRVVRRSTNGIQHAMVQNYKISIGLMSQSAKSNDFYAPTDGINRFYSTFSSDSTSEGDKTTVERSFVETPRERRLRLLSALLAVLSAIAIYYYSSPLIYGEEETNMLFRGVNAIKKKNDDIATLTELIEKIEKGETVNIEQLHRLLNDVALPIGKKLTNPMITSSQKNFFLEHPLAWELMLDIAINDANPKKREQFTNLVRILARDIDLAESIAKSSLSVILGLIQLSDNQPISSESSERALQIFRILLAQRTTHRHFHNKDIEKLDTLLSNRRFYQLFYEGVIDAMNTPIPANKNCQIVVNLHPKLKTALIRKYEGAKSAEQLKALLESEVAIETYNLETIAKLIAVFGFPFLSWYWKGTMTKWAHTKHLTRSTAVLMLALALGTWGFSRAPAINTVFPVGKLDTSSVFFYCGVIAFLAAMYLSPSIALASFFFEGAFQDKQTGRHIVVV